MKKNAVFRIVLWSLVILCLGSILLAGLGLRSYRSHTRVDRTREAAPTAITSPMEDPVEIATLGKDAAVHGSPSVVAPVYDELKAGTQITILRRETVGSQVWAYIESPTLGWILLENPQNNTELNAELMPTAPAATEETAILAAAATVYSSPSVESRGHNGELSAGTEITITRRELVNNQQWAYTTAPIQGWILTENLEQSVVEVTEPTKSVVEVTGPTEPVVYTAPTSPDIYGSSMLANGISAISIDWVSGNIHMIPTTGDRITLLETESDRPMVWRSKAGKLSIEFSEERRTLGTPKSKDLVIEFPIGWTCQDLKINAASSDIAIQGLTAQKVEIDAASGRTEFVECTVGSLEMDTASGDVYYVGSLDALECDAASANFTATLTNHPRKLEMSSASGSMDLTLPADTGFTVRMEGLKTVFAPNDFQVTKKNGAYIHGDGSCHIEMESMSGGIHLQKAKTA